jgi:hypothetical protein
MMQSLDLFSGAELKKGGISVAIDHANLKHDGWSNEAYKALKSFLNTHKNSFMCEEVRKFAHFDLGLVQPPSSRAWGGIFQRAVREKIIKHVGFGQVTNPKAHKANASLWMAA